VLSRSKAKRTAPSEPVDAFEVRQWERDELGQLVHFDVTV
jgi:hypothetical protein